MTPTVKPFVLRLSDSVTIIRGDCLGVLPTLEGVDAVISDPPYGMDWDGKVTRGKNGTGKAGPTRHHGKRILSDKEDFDPSPWTAFEKVVLWGWLHFAQRLEKGTALVWLKRYDDGFGSFLSDADIAWMKGGHGHFATARARLERELSQGLLDFGGGAVAPTQNTSVHRMAHGQEKESGI